jgi:hypothetical protein
MTPAQLHRLPPGIRVPFTHAFVNSLDVVFLVAVPLAAVGFILSLFLKDIRLRETAGLAAEVTSGSPAAEVPVLSD